MMNTVEMQSAIQRYIEELQDRNYSTAHYEARRTKVEAPAAEGDFDDLYHDLQFAAAWAERLVQLERLMSRYEARLVSQTLVAGKPTDLQQVEAARLFAANPKPVLEASKLALQDARQKLTDGDLSPLVEAAKAAGEFNSLQDMLRIAIERGYLVSAP